MTKRPVVGTVRPKPPLGSHYVEHRCANCGCITNSVGFCSRACYEAFENANVPMVDSIDHLCPNCQIGTVEGGFCSTICYEQFNGEDAYGKDYYDERLGDKE